MQKNIHKLNLSPNQKQVVKDVVSLFYQNRKTINLHKLW